MSDRKIAAVPRTSVQDQGAARMSKIITIFQRVLIFEQSVTHADRDRGRKLARLRRGSGGTATAPGFRPLTCSSFVLYDRRQESSSRTMPPRYAFRLEDLRVFHLVRASCHACGHKAIIPNAALLGRPGYTRLMALERQLRCRRCGTRGKASLDVEFRPRD